MIDKHINLILELLDLNLTDLLDLFVKVSLILLQGNPVRIIKIVQVVLALLDLQIDVLGVLLHRNQCLLALIKNGQFLVQFFPIKALLSLVEALLQFLYLALYVFLHFFMQLLVLKKNVWMIKLHRLSISHIYFDIIYYYIHSELVNSIIFTDLF